MPVMWAINTTFHTTLFNCDMIFPTSFITNWLVCHQQSQTSSITICHWCQNCKWILPRWQSSHLLWHWKSIFG
jgi:hypothetical protein